MAERLLWHSMLDNPYYLFYPLLNQFNVLYKVIKDNKRKPKLTVEDSAAELLVRHYTTCTVQLSSTTCPSNLYREVVLLQGGLSHFREASL